MENVEERAISTFHASILFWKHFVDEAMVTQFLEHLNSMENYCRVG